MTLGRMISLLLGSMGLRLAGAAIGLMTQLVLARSLPPPDVGIVFLAMSAAALISMAVTAGYPTLALTQLPRLFALKLKEAPQYFHGAFERDWLFWNAIGLTLLSAYGWGFNSDAGIWLALVFGALSTVGSSLLRYNSAVANSQKRFGLAFIPDSLLRPGLFFLYIAICWLMRLEISMLHVLWVFVLSNTVVALGQALVIGRDGVHPAHLRKSKAVLTRVLRPRAGASMVVAGVSTTFADIVTFLSGLILAPHNVAIVAICIRLSALAGYVIQSTQQFVLPDLAAAVTRHDRKAAIGILHRMNLLTLGIMGAGLGVVLAAGHLFLRLFGPAYQEGYWLLVMCMAAQTIRALSGMNQHLLSIGGYQTRSAWASVIGLVVLLCGSIVLSRNFGLLGIGYAVMLAELTWALLQASQAQHLLGWRGDLLGLALSKPS